MNQPFRIFKVAEAEASKIADTPNEVHHHDFEELIIGIEGSLEHFIDFKSTTIQAPFVSFVTRGKVHRVQPGLHNGAFQIWVLRFKSEFIAETTFQLYAQYHDHANIPLQPGACFGRLVKVCEMIFDEMQQSTPDLAVIRHLLSALFTMIESERRKVDPGETAILSSQNTTFKNFLAILEENFRRPEGVEFYAEKLFMSPRNLNLICNQILQKSVSELIETRKLVEAKNLLTTTDRTIAEIGYDLGYNDKAYFTAVFKKKSGQTPSEFRQEMRRLIS
ncbi:MAG: helix-turn-helix domain-containing protein [Saprospiraceae bacterium]|nr:helix-turn-helix domain-containing protein [Saprospiraceae bacterium]